MSQLAAFLGVQLGGTLPAIRFFEPKRKFIRYLVANNKDMLLYDIGAGVGHVARALAEAGLSVMALDLYRRDDEQFPIILADATAYVYKAGSGLLFCRPSHEGFVEKTIATGLKCGVSQILYVGLPTNRRQDLGVYSRRFRKVLSDAGEGNESLYRMYGDGSATP
jgi:hypothetical protein